MIGHHSTILRHLEEILHDHAIVPGKTSPEDESHIFEWMTLGQYRSSSSEHVYFWTSFDQACRCARYSSAHARQEYTAEDRRPVVITVDVPDDELLSPDPDSKGYRYRGALPEGRFLTITQV
ncbi:TPA: hypothetical protein HA251_07650 [Candidatus Woesearchaeota archaeon]|nr:hypothetical protein [Candidatus Woesearchaeota archaeon]